MRTLLIVLLLCLGASSVRADDAPSNAAKLVPALEAFFAETDASKRAAAGMRIAMDHPDAKAVAAAAAKARRWKTDGVKDDVATWKRSTADGVEHTIFAKIPASYDAAKATPVLIYLHGGVSRPRDGGGGSAVRSFGELADKEGFILLAPSTQTGAEWWTPNGVALVRGALEDLARGWHVDAERVAMTGFSDGASGCFHILAHDPEPYACFMPMMAHVALTRMLGGPCFAANVGSRPVFAFNGGNDTLYPSEGMKPFVQELKEAGCRLEWTDLPEAGHRINSVLPEHWGTLREFWASHPREAAPKHVRWETGVPQREGRLAWIEILRVDPKAPSAEGQEEERLPEPRSRPKLGIRVDRGFEGPGLRIEHVEEGSAAADAGFEVDDIVLSVDGSALEGGAALRVLVQALGTMTDRDGAFEIKRGEETLTIKTRPRAGTEKRSKALGYGVPSGRVDATLVGGNRIDVLTRHVRRFKLHLADGMVDLAKPVKVYVNGKLAFEGMAEGDTGYVLQQAARQIGGPAYRAFVVVGL